MLHTPRGPPSADLLSDKDWDEKRRNLTAEAITLHLNLWPPRQSPEAWAVFVGARLDVTGYRYEEVDPGVAAGILNTYPRLDLKRQSAPMFDRQAAVNPETRVHFYPLPRREVVHATR